MKSFLRSINDAARFEKAKKNIVVENKKVKQNILENKKVKQNILENKKDDCNPKEEKKIILSLDSEEKTKKLYKIKETLETRIINLQWRMKSIDIKYVLNEVKELEEEYLENKEEIIKMYGDEYKEKFNRLEKLIKQAYKNEEQKKEQKRKRKLNLMKYENDTIENLKYKKSEDNENSEALKEIDRYIISTYRTYITENEMTKEDREEIKSKESKKYIRGYYGLRSPPQNNECCEGHRDFLNRHINMKENVEDEIYRIIFKEKKYNVEMFEEIQYECEEVENNIIENIEEVEEVKNDIIENIEEVNFFSIFFCSLIFCYICSIYTDYISINFF